APPLARERHEPFVGAVAAAHSGKARQDATREELPQLLLHEVRHAGAIGALGRVAEEGLEMVADQPVEDHALRAARLVLADGHGAPSSQGCAARISGREGTCLATVRRDVTSTRNIALPSAYLGACRIGPSGGWTVRGGSGG